jgi:hypothetical protein
MLVIRPLNIFVSSINSALSFKEKLFLSWIGPRGIVAASVTSLFAFELEHIGFEGAEVLVPLVFSIIVGSVVLNSLTAKPLARLLGVAEPDPQGFLILGAHPFARQIASFLKTEGFTVKLADTNWANVASARAEGLEAYYGSLLSEQSVDEVDLAGIGHLLALTSNDEANALTVLKYAREFGSQNVYQLEPARSGARGSLGHDQRGRTLFRKGTTYAEISRLFDSGAKLKKTALSEKFKLADFIKIYGEDYLPIFVINGPNIRILNEESLVLEKGSTLVSLVVGPKEQDGVLVEASN